MPMCGRVYERVVCGIPSVSICVNVVCYFTVVDTVIKGVIFE